MSEIVKPLSGTQKVAVLLMSFDPLDAAEVMKRFTQDEAEEISAEIIKLRRVSPEVTDATVAEFYEHAISGQIGARGGRDLAESLLETAFGSEAAAGLMGRVANSMAGRSFEFLDDADPQRVATLLEGEMPYTAAVVLIHVRPALASLVLQALDDAERIAIAESIASMGTPTPESVAMVAQSMKSRAGAAVTPKSTVEVVGGVQPLVDIINRSDAATERAVLDGLESKNKELADEVRARMLTFTDLVKLESRDVQQVLRGIDIVILAVAMKGAPDNVTAAIKQNLSERNRELLEDELNAQGQVRKSEVEEARAEVVRSIRELADRGEIVIHRADEDGFVD